MRTKAPSLLSKPQQNHHNLFFSFEGLDGMTDLSDLGSFLSPHRAPSRSAAAGAHGPLRKARHVPGTGDYTGREKSASRLQRFIRHEKSLSEGTSDFGMCERRDLVDF